MKNSLIIEKLVSLNATSRNYNKSLKSKEFSKDEKEFIKSSKTLEKDIKKFFDKKEKELKLKNDSLLAKQIKISVKKYYSFLELGDKIANCFNAGYSMGGLIQVWVEHGKNKILVGTKDNRSEYSRTSKYKAIHGFNRIFLSKKEFEKIEIIGGIPTIKLENSKISKCIMLLGKGHKNNYNIIGEECFLTGTFHGKTFESCEKWRKDEYIRKCKNRNSTKNLNIVLEKFVGLEHSLNAGNCKTGTEMFANRHNLDINFGYKLGYLLSLDPNNNFLNNIVNNLQYSK